MVLPDPLLSFLNFQELLKSLHGEAGSGKTI